jgi:cation diffusion facilitator family transporter
VAHKDSQKVIYAAIIANVAIAICKYAAAIFTGSSAMWAEAFHSTADSGNELLLLVGIKRSTRPPDALHPYGHGKALYFYSLLVAVYIFGIGGGLAVHHGITHLKNPQIPDHPGWNYAVLLFAAVFEGYSWVISYRELRRRKEPNENAWDQIIGSKDPTVFTVFLEDCIGLIGTLLAFLGIFLGRLLNNPYLDPIASIAIGVLLAAVAVFLGRESGALLLGERTDRSKIRRAQEIINADPAVEKTGDLLTMQLGPEQVLLNVEIQFRRDLSIEALEAAIDRIETRIREKEPTIQRIFIEAESFTRSKARSSRAA